MRRRLVLWRWLIAALFLCFLAAIVIAADRGRLPGFIMAFYAFPSGDKIGHFLLIGLLSFLVNLCLPARPLVWRDVVIASLAIALLATLEEFSQAFLRTRTASWRDLFAGYAGIICAGALVWDYRRWRSRRGFDRAAPRA